MPEPNQKPGVVAVIGGGVMGETIMGGLLRSGWDARQVRVSDRRVERLVELHDRYGVITEPNNSVLVSGAKTVLLAVKPQDAVAVLDEIAGHLDRDAVLVSICVGLPTSLLSAHLRIGQPVIRVMPNTPARVSQGMSVISPSPDASPEQTERVRAMLQGVGPAIVLPETYQDAAGALSGSGPAYFCYVAEAMIEAGVQRGLTRPIATQLVVQTMLGTATLLQDTGEHPALLREAVTSPGGTTAAAVRQLDARGVREGFYAAVEAATQRSAELARQAEV